MIFISSLVFNWNLIYSKDKMCDTRYPKNFPIFIRREKCKAIYRA